MGRGRDVVRRERRTITFAVNQGEQKDVPALVAQTNKPKCARAVGRGPVTCRSLARTLGQWLVPVGRPTDEWAGGARERTHHAPVCRCVLTH